MVVHLYECEFIIFLAIFPHANPNQTMDVYYNTSPSPRPCLGSLVSQNFCTESKYEKIRATKN